MASRFHVSAFALLLVAGTVQAAGLVFEDPWIRAAPPGAWLYVGLGALFGVILVAGVVRALRRPRASIDTRGLDPVDPTPEEPLVAPVQRHTAP